MRLIRFVLVTALISACAPTRAAEVQSVQGVVSLAATASIEVARDVMSVVLAATREGPDPSSVQSALKQALDGALTEGRKVAKPGQVDVQSGNFSLYPRYGPKGTMTAWQGTAEMMVEGKDMTAIAQLTGRITTMTIARVGYGLSREQRERVEAEVVAQAIARYRAKATETARQFGYTGYVIREVNVSANEPPPVMPLAMARARTTAAADESLPVEPGRGSVVATVSGTIQLTK